jgi:H+-transporting ATPase
MTGHAVLTPMLLVISMITGDFLAMLSTTDNVRISQAPNVWKVGALTVAGICLGFCDLIFCGSVLAVGKYHLGLDLKALQTLSIVTLIFTGQAILYVVRDRRHLWSSRPSSWLMVASAADVLIIATLATRGILMKALSVALVVALFAITVVFCFVLDAIKAQVFSRLQLADAGTPSKARP